MKDRVLGAGAIVLRVANWLNWICVALFATALLLSLPFAGTVMARLVAEYGAAGGGVLKALRLMLGIGILAGFAAHVVFARLLAIVATVQAGDPFVTANAVRLVAIGWAVLALQLLDVAFGALTGWFALHGVESGGWSPSVGGWISVLMIFVLARVFTIGARMRDDLAGTV